MKHIVGKLIICLLLITMSGCKVKYSFTGASIPANVKTISIQYFPSSAPLAPPTLSQQFTESLREIFLNQTSLGVLQRNGDMNLEGTITNYMTTPMAIQSGNDAAAYNQLSITVSVKFTNNKDEKQNFEQSFTNYANYNSTENLAKVEQELIAEINKKLVQDIFNRSVSNW
jgi:hypothetical protein